MTETPAGTLHLSQIRFQAHEEISEEIQLKGLSASEMEQIVPAGTVLLGYRGSIVHGMYRNPDHHSDAIDDKDIMGVAISPLDTYFGLRHFEQREAKIREWDSVVYEYRKFVRLLCQGNPNVLSLLWIEPHYYIYRHPAGQALIDDRELFNSRRVYHAFTGYAYSQLKRMTHLAHQGYMGEKRKALVEKFGYDTKNAAHLIRLLRMGIEFLKDGVLYVKRPDAPQLMEIKLGGWTLDQVKAEADHLFKRAEAAFDACMLPKTPDERKINSIVTEVLWDYFSATERRWWISKEG